MRLQAEQMPPHKADCDGADVENLCAGCRWLREQDLDARALQAFFNLFHYVPRDSYRQDGMGLG